MKINDINLRASERIHNAGFKTFVKLHSRNTRRDLKLHVLISQANDVFVLKVPTKPYGRVPEKRVRPLGAPFFGVIRSEVKQLLIGEIT